MQLKASTLILSAACSPPLDVNKPLIRMAQQHHRIIFRSAMPDKCMYHVVDCDRVADIPEIDPFATRDTSLQHGSHTILCRIEPLRKHQFSHVALLHPSPGARLKLAQHERLFAIAILCVLVDVTHSSGCVHNVNFI